MMTAITSSCSYSANLPLGAARKIGWQPRSRISHGSKAYTDERVLEVKAEHSVPAALESNVNEVDRFDWKRQWYPAAVVSDLPTDRPTAVVILGKDLVLWRDGSHEWRAFEDKCPHRKVPLSEGRIETDGTLQCAYHGWRFNGGGVCTTIPQATSHAEHDRLIAVPRACATSYPTCMGDGLIFVWMHAGPNALEESSRNPPKFLRDTLPDKDRVGRPWLCRDLTMQWEMLVENLTDPSHAAFSHHGVMQGASREKPVMTAFRGAEEYMECDKGYSLTSEPDKFPFPGFPERIVTSKVVLSPPCHTELVTYLLDANKGEQPFQRMAVINSHSVPVTRGTSRVFLRAEADFLAGTLPGHIVKMTPTFLAHLPMQEVLDGDSVFLSRQSEMINSGSTSHKEYYLAAPCDGPTSAFWRWMMRFAPEGVDFYGDVPDPIGKCVPREAALDRYKQHVKQCKACSGALKNIQLALNVIPVLAGASFLLLAALLGQGLTLSPITTASTAVIGLCALAWQWLKRLEKRFIFSDYVHADR